MSEAINIVAVDESETAVLGLAESGSEKLRILSWARNAAGGADSARLLEPDVVYISLRGTGDPWRATREIHAAGIPVLIVTDSRLLTHADRALECGASGIATKAANSVEAIDALIQVAGGGEHWDSPWAERVDAIRGGEPTTMSMLSDEEIAVVRRLSDGKNQDEIANELGVSDRTVRRLLVSLRRRIDVVGDVEMIAKLVRIGWVEPSFFE